MTRFEEQPSVLDASGSKVLASSFGADQIGIRIVFKKRHPPVFVGPTPTSFAPQPEITNDFVRYKVKEKVQ